jgi:hypothetical protein
MKYEGSEGQGMLWYKGVMKLSQLVVSILFTVGKSRGAIEKTNVPLRKSQNGANYRAYDARG